MTATATATERLEHTAVRRFCACGRNNVCRCDLPRPLTSWSVEALQQLRQRRIAGYDLKQAAAAAGVTVQECNQALDALVGKTATHALAVLEARAARR